ncbi:hypothetical protein [Nocardia asiatica]|uniref:hypothetical protein n=1 Tax=Nocardia asiatica TaxID=209252 RepID=UPI003EE3044E
MPPDTRSALLDSAIRLLDAGGVEAVTLREVGLGELPSGEPVRLAALLRASAHGAADLSAAGHLAADGKGHADATDLVDDLVAYLRPAA